MQLSPNKKIYFASDFHLGIPDKPATIEREKRLCAWLDEIQKDAAILYLVGDIFDAWFEYKNVVPKGFTRFLGKLAMLRDQGLVIEAFTGNHDLWMRGYFQEELDIPVHHAPIIRTFNNKKFLIAHGDGLGPGDNGYKLMKKVLNSSIAQWLYRRIHPDTGVGIASWLSKKGPKHVSGQEDKFLGEQEWLVQYARSILQKEDVDYFIFGHRHIACEYPLTEQSKYINLGDWIRYDSYAVFDGNDLQLKFHKKS